MYVTLFTYTKYISAYIYTYIFIIPIHYIKHTKMLIVNSTSNRMIYDLETSYESICNFILKSAQCLEKVRDLTWNERYIPTKIFLKNKNLKYFKFDLIYLSKGSKINNLDGVCATQTCGRDT